MNLLHASADELLSTPVDEVCSSLGATPTAASRTWRLLAHRWHPDRSPDPQATAVFARLADAHRRWRPAGAGKQVEVRTDSGTSLILRYQHMFRHEPSVVYAAHQHVMEIYDSPHVDLAERAWSNASHLPFLTPAMRAQMAASLPGSPLLHRLKDDRAAFVFTKSQTLVRLADVVHRLGSIDPRHVAWIGSGLWNLACYLEVVGWTHQAIAADTVWIDPSSHRVALLGGWAYAGPVGTPWRALPAASVRQAPLAIRSARQHATALDHILIRRLLEELLATATAAPSALVLNARLPAGGSSVEQYRAWKQALYNSFGPPAFVHWDLSPTTFYQEH